MKKVFFYFLENKISVLMFLLLFLVSGIIAIFHLPIELLPNQEPPIYKITTIWEDNNSELVEAKITSKLEASLSQLKDLKSISSESTLGLSTIFVEFYDTKKSKQQLINITERLIKIKEELPKGTTKPEVARIDENNNLSKNTFFSFSLIAKDLEITQGNKILRELTNKLYSIQGVVDVEVNGLKELEYEILLDENKAKLYGINEKEIIKSIQKSINLLNFENGIGNTNTLIIKNNEIDLSYINNIKIKQFGASYIRLRDVAEIKKKLSDSKRIYKINDKSGITLNIFKSNNANSLEVSKNIHKILNNDLKQLPLNVDYKVEYDGSEQLKKEINDLFWGGLISLIVLIIVVVLIYRDFKKTIILFVSLVFSLAFALTLFYIFDLSFNILTIAALVIGFGFIIDNSIIVLDYLNEHYLSNSNMRLSILLKNIFPPILTATLTTGIIIIPVLIIPGEIKNYIYEFVRAVIFLLIASVIVSFLIIPQLWKVLHNAQVHLKKKPPLNYLYDRLLRFVISKRRFFIWIPVLLIGLPVWKLPYNIDTPLLKTVYNMIFNSEIYYNLKPTYGYVFGGAWNLFENYLPTVDILSEYKRNFILVDLKIKNEKDEAAFISIVNEYDLVLSKIESNTSLKTLILEKRHAILKFLCNSEYDIINCIRIKDELFDCAYKNSNLDISITVLDESISISNGRESGSYIAEMTGYNYQQLLSFAKDIKSKLGEIKKISNVTIESPLDKQMQQDSYPIVLNNNFLAKNSIPKIFVGNLALDEFSSDEVRIPIEDNSNSIISIKNTNTNLYPKLVFIPKSGIYNKDSIWSSKINDNSLSSIKKENQSYQILIKYDYKGDPIKGIYFLKTIDEKFKLPSGYTISEPKMKYSGEQINNTFIILASLLIIFFCTSILYNSIKYPLVIISIVPIAIAGGIYSLFFFSGVIDRGAFCGILLLIGLSVNSGIFLLEELIKLNSTKLDEIIVVAGSRLKPILSTMFTTIGSLFPIYILSTQYFWKSLSVTVIGGIFVSVVYVMFYVPIIYYKLYLWRLK